MKKMLIGILCVCLLLSLSACGSVEVMDTETNWTVWQIAEAIRTSQEPQVEMTAITPEDELYKTYLTASSQSRKTMTLCRRTHSVSRITRTKRKLSSNRCQTEPLEEMSPPPSTSPTPSPTPSSVPEPLESIPAAEPEISAEPPATPTPAAVSWRYDKASLLTAWASGDWSGLSTENQDILGTCAQAISSAVPEGLSDYEKELAIHDWMIAWGSYDSNNVSQIPGFQENPNNDNPYGFLVGRKGICLGYATTFQLFMDLLGIECITVSGTAYDRVSAHAWNQVCLDGEWYCVDVTWDDPTTSGPLSSSATHRYFNVTSDHMRATRHYWDETAVPNASGTTYSWN